MKKVFLIIACAALLFSMTACENNESPIPTYNVSPTNTTIGTLATGQPDETPTDGTIPTQPPTTSPTDPSEEEIPQSDPTTPQQSIEPSEPTAAEDNSVTAPTVPNAVITETPQNTTALPTNEAEGNATEATQPTTQTNTDTKRPSLSIDNIAPPVLETHNPAPEDNYALWWPCEHCGKWIETREGHACYNEKETH